MQMVKPSPPFTAETGGTAVYFHSGDPSPAGPLAALPPWRRDHADQCPGYFSPVPGHEIQSFEVDEN